MKREYLIIFYTFTLIGCAGQEATNPSFNKENELNKVRQDSITDTSEKEEVVYNDLEEGTPLTVLVEKFKNIEALDTSDLITLREELRDFALFPQVEGYFETELGHALVYYVHGMCASIHCYGDICISYFDYDENYINSVWTPIINENYEVFAVQDKFIGVMHRYKEYEMGEHVEEATGKIIEEYVYYAEYDDHLQDIEELQGDELAILRNWIFAKHGYIFKSEKYINYFKDFGWYNPTFENVDHLLTVEEKMFADYLLELEKFLQ